MSGQSRLALVPALAFFIVALLALQQGTNAATSVTLSSTAQTETTVTLSWTQSTDVTFVSYTLYYSTTGIGGPWHSTFSTTNKSQTSTFTSGLAPNTNYWFYIQDRDSLGTASSNVVQATTKSLPSLQINGATTTTISLAWTDYNTYSSLVPFDSYTIQSGSSPTGPWTTLTTITSPSQTSYVATGLAPGQTYYLSLFDTVGKTGSLQSSNSNTVTMKLPRPAPSVTISAFPYPTSIKVGQSIPISSSVVGGSAPFTYQWYSNGSPVASATSSTFTFSSNFTGTYSIYVIVRDSASVFGTSNSITVVVSLTSTHMTLTAPTTTNLGALIGISAKLTDESGNPLPDQTVVFDIGSSASTFSVSTIIGSAVTDSSGTASLTYSVDVAAGSYYVEANYSGTQKLAGSSATSPLIVEPYYLTVTTAVPNAQMVSVNGVIYATDVTGRVRIAIGERGSYNVGILPLYVTTPGVGAAFVKWGDGTTSNPRTVIIDANKSLSAVTKTQYRLIVEGPVGSTPTGSGWYDASAVTNASVGYSWGVVGGSRTNLQSYALDGGSNVAVPRMNSGTYSFPVNMNSPHTVVFVGVEQYYVNVTSDYGTPSGSGWYDANSNASFSVSPTSLTVGFLSYHVFTGWSGGSTSKSSAASVVVVSPLTISATWTVDSTQLYIAVTGIVALAVVLGAVFWVRSRRPRSSPI